MDKAELTVWIENFIRQDSLNISIVRLWRALGAGAVVYLVGGAIRDIAIRAIHGRQIQVKDIDLFIEGVESLGALQPQLAGDRFETTDLGGLRWHPHDSKYPFDLCRMKDFVVLKKYGWAPNLDNLLACIDFTIDAVAYDIGAGELFERGAIADIERRWLAFNTRQFYSRTAVAYRVLWLIYRTDFTLSPGVFDFLRSGIDLDTLTKVKAIFVFRKGKLVARRILKEYDRLSAFHNYSDYCRGR